MEGRVCVNRFVIIAVYRERADRLNQTVANCLDQMEEKEKYFDTGYRYRAGWL